jgi:hypothetical protein
MAESCFRRSVILVQSGLSGGESAMLIAVARETHIPEWLYPHRLAPLSGESMKTGDLTQADLNYLWSVFDVNSPPTSAFDIAVSTHCDVGFDHDAEDWLPRLDPKFAAALAGLSDVQRWQVCQKWTPRRLGRHPNNEQFSSDKKRLKTLCEFASRAAASQWFIVFIED